MSTLELAVKEIPQLIKLLKEKFSQTPELKFTSDGNIDLFYSGELELGTEVFIDFNKEMDDCMKSAMEKGKSKDEAHEACKLKGKMERVPAPSKTYKHTDGTEITIEQGKVVDIKTPHKIENQKTDMKMLAEEIFKAFPKTDLSGIETALTELKTTLSAISAEKKELKEKVDKFETFKAEVIGILEKFSKQPSVPPAPAKNTSSKSIFNTELTFEERVKILNETKI